MKLDFFNTYISPDANRAISELLDSTMLSEGKMVQQFEASLIHVLGVKNPIAVNSGTSALHLALVLAGVGTGDEVILPAQTFVATGLVVLMQGASPVFADIKLDTGNIDPASVREKLTNRTKAIMAVHWGGCPVDLSEIQEIADRHGIPVIEDAAHAAGAEYQGRPIGSISDYTCFSFQAIKHITTGDGGALCCREEDKYRKAMARRWFGIDRRLSIPSLLGERQYDIASLGFKYHMNDYAAALGITNLSSFPERLEKRKSFASSYRTALNGIPGIKLLQEAQDRKSAYWLFGMLVEKRDDFILAMTQRGVPVSVVHQRIDRNSVFGGLRKDLENQALFDAAQIHLPIHDALDDEKVTYIIDSVRKGW